MKTISINGDQLTLNGKLIPGRQNMYCSILKLFEGAGCVDSAYIVSKLFAHLPVSGGRNTMHVNIKRLRRLLEEYLGGEWLIALGGKYYLTPKEVSKHMESVNVSIKVAS